LRIKDQETRLTLQEHDDDDDDDDELFLCLLHVSNPRAHLQEEHNLLPTRLLIMMHVKRTISELYINVSLKMNSRIRSM
jgi:hypothetical protein